VLDLADSLAQFPAEDPQRSPVTPDRQPSASAADALLAFTSESVIDTAQRVPPSAATRHGFPGVRRMRHGISALGALVLLVVRVLCRHVSASAAWIQRVARIAWRASAIMGRTCAAALTAVCRRCASDAQRVARIAWRTSAITSRTCASALRVVCVRCASHAHGFSRRVVRIAWRGALATGRISATLLRRLRLAGVSYVRYVARGKRERHNPFRGLATGTATLAHPLIYFLAGAVAGAALMTLARVPSGRDVEAVVSASASTPAPPQAIVPPQPPPMPATVPLQSGRAAAADLPPSIQFVSTTGKGTTPRLPSPTVRGIRAVPNVRPARAEGAVATPPSQPPQPFLGSITVSSTPEGASVFVNGRQVGTTPVVLPDLSVGSRALRLTMAGYDTWSASVRVVAGQQTTVSASLHRSLP
jgi:PEGA domain-containing protein